ncbi:MAG: M20/M25/M40 family metallo-hydrolase [Gemmatimonadetes bacterium]|nr:M20/M25/M40 family metallo-hydrolase [Gemmatimonadota bacterium]
MSARVRETLLRLLDAPGPSGFETVAAEVWRDIAGEFADEVWTDVHGNSFASNAANGPTVMLAGHVDEIGLMVHYIDDDGYLFVRAVGGWDPQVLVGQRVEILGADGSVDGVIGRRAIHLIEAEERDKAVKLKDLWVDIGAADGEAARARVAIGDVGIIRSDTLTLGESSVAGRSVDDRAGATVALEALRRGVERGTAARGVAVATTQEEISGKSGWGARTSSFELAPDAAIVIDVTHATDHPRSDKKEHGDVRLGAGPVLSRGAVINPRLLDALVASADAADVALQWQAAPSVTGTDADNIFTTRAGIATAIVSIPNRYMHSPNQLVDLEDLDAAVEVIAGFLTSIDADADFLAG